MPNSDNKRIVKNTALLYVRMGVNMIISFLTARVIFNALGIEDYGIYNVVGGLVVIFSILCSSMTSATNRFLTYDLGKKDCHELRNTFSISLNIHVLISLIVFVVLETVGLWFLNTELNIPSTRMEAANWVYQSSVLVFIVGIMTIPYNAIIIAHERMSLFAYLSFFEAGLRLALVFAVYFYAGDKLILYGILVLVQTIAVRSCYYIYCKRNFAECAYKKVSDRKKFKQILNYAGWTFFGCTAVTMKDQGVNIAINLFTGPVINAARGIAMQIDSMVGVFVRSFMTALNPQIIKEYAANAYERVYSLVIIGTKLSYFLFMLFAIPVFFEVEFILKIWLGQVPEHTVLFVRLALVMTSIDILSNLLIVTQEATGKIRLYQIVESSILFLNFPVSYLLLYLGCIPESTVIVAIAVSHLAFIARLFLLRRVSAGFSIRRFIEQTYLRVLAVTLLSVIPVWVVYEIFPSTVYRFIVSGIVSVLFSFLCIYYAGCNTYERSLLMSYMKVFLGKFKR